MSSLDIVLGLRHVGRDNMTRRCAKMGGLIIVSSLAVSGLSFADSSAAARRDKALKEIDACMVHNEMSSRPCQHLDKNIQVLVTLYQGGDKTLLPKLLAFPNHLPGFFGEALVGDPQTFLTDVSVLSEKDRQAVLASLAGGTFGVPKPQFDAIRTTLKQVSDSSSNYQLARACLLRLEAENASLLLNYFPPRTFTGRAGDFEVHWFSREMFALQEKPLWPPNPENEGTYRITVLPAFFPAESVTLKPSSDGTAAVRFRTTDSHREHLETATTRTITPQQVVGFAATLDSIQFWQLPTELPQMGEDGADWILEGVQNGQYHIVLRWCPTKTPFGKPARILFDLAGQKSKGGC